MLFCISLPSEVMKILKCLAIFCGWVILFSLTINVEGLLDALLEFLYCLSLAIKFLSYFCFV